MVKLVLAWATGCPLRAITLDYRVGGLVFQRHNEVRDAIGDLSSFVWKQVQKEPIVCESNSTSEPLIADLRVCGVWEPLCV